MKTIWKFSKPLHEVDWLKVWLPRLTRPLKHPGNHRYAWSLTGPGLESLGAYPKKVYAEVIK